MINQNNLKKSSNILRAIAHPIRLAIIKYIAESGTTNVNMIYSTLKLEQSITSQHLRVLRITELVNTRRDGKFIHYAINYAKIAQLNSILKEFFAKKVDIDSDLLDGTEDLSRAGEDIQSKVYKQNSKSKAS
ncbi:hypothetical protein BH09PAT2_BH09PAT2_10930 [soil metagenome]